MKAGAVITFTLTPWHYPSLNKWFLFYRRMGEVGEGLRKKAQSLRHQKAGFVLVSPPDICNTQR